MNVACAGRKVRVQRSWKVSRVYMYLYSTRIYMTLYMYFDGIITFLC